MLAQEKMEGLALEVDSLTVGYEGQSVLGPLSFNLPQGGSLAVIGESGCGKSTLLTTLAGLHPALGGTVLWRDREETVSLEEHRTSFVWQRLGLFPWKRVKENLLLPLKLHPEICPVEERESRIAQMVSHLGLTGL